MRLRHSLVMKGMVGWEIRRGCCGIVVLGFWNMVFGFWGLGFGFLVLGFRSVGL